MQFHPNRILCVEDDEDSSLMMKVLLGMWNYEVVLAPTAADGFRLAQSERFDLCLLDTSLPDESGVDLCRRISQDKKGKAMTSIEREKIEALTCKAKVIRDVWLREREDARVVLVSANAEVRRGWRESDNGRKVEPVRMPHSFRRAR